MSNKGQKVYVGLSGGVDSSVSAALLKEQGYEVTGVFIKAWYPDFLNCNWKEEKRDVMRICAHLDIPFKMLDLSKEYKEGVIDYLISEYKKGRTPNPDVMCNQKVKFGAFFDWAIEDGADFVATGHYAQIKKVGDEFGLFKSKDTEKDQTYFLWTLEQRHLEKTLFPIGHLEKKDVRKIAENKGLFTYAKKDSQGLCFLGPLNMKDFLKKFIETKEGNVLDENGEIIGKHSGAELFTIGERHGFETFKKNPDSKPLFVISKDLKENKIIVSENKPVIKNISNNEIKLEKINFNVKVEESSMKLNVRLRYRQDLQEMTLDIKNQFLISKEGTEVGTEGQSAVFYNENQCLGGAIITS